MRPSSPRSSRISSTTARYSVSSSRVRSSVGMPSFRSSTSTSRRPCGSVSAAPAMPRCRPSIATAAAPPGSRTRSVTRATVPTAAYSPSCFGTSSTRSSSPTSTVSVTFMWGKTTMSSSGTSSSLVTVPFTLLRQALSVVGAKSIPTTHAGGCILIASRTEPSQSLRRLPLQFRGGSPRSRYRLPRDHRTGTDAHSEGADRPAARAPPGALAPRRTPAGGSRLSRGSGAAPPARPGPRGRPSAVPAPARSYVITAATKMPPRQTTRPASWRAGSIQPALWRTTSRACARRSGRACPGRRRARGRTGDSAPRPG